MNQKQIGIIIMIMGIILAGMIYAVKIREDQFIKNMIGNSGTCFLNDGSCLHADRDFTFYIVGEALSVAMIIFGAYLRFFDRTQQVLAEHQIKVSSALQEAKKAEKNKDEFGAFLSGFSDDEKKILLTVKDQDGIPQSTLRFKTGLSKTTLSLLLQSLEQRQIVSRKEKGKTKEVYLRKVF